MHRHALIAQLGERKTEDLEVTGSIPVQSTFFYCPKRDKGGYKTSAKQLVGRKRGVKRLLKLRLTQDFRLGNFSYDKRKK